MSQTVPYPGVLGPSYVSVSQLSSEETINQYLEKNETPNAPTPYALVPTPGFSTKISVSQAPIRGEFAQNGRAFFVAGFAFCEAFYDSATGLWSSTQRGTVNADANPVTIHANGDAGNQLWITSGGVGYVYDLTADTLTVAGPAGTTVSMGGYLSGRFLSLDALTGAFYASDIYDGLTWDLTFVAQSQSGDPWRALIVTPDELIHLLGENSSEVWANQGASPFPFSQVSGAGSAYGIVAPFAWAVDTQLSWVAQNAQGRGIVVRAVGYTPERVSTHAIEHALGGLTDFADLAAFKYQERGHSHFVLTAPSLDVTFVYDSTTGFWHKRAVWDSTVGSWKAYRPCCAMSAFGQTIVGDRVSGDLYLMASDLYSDVGGVALRRLREPPVFGVQQKRVTVHSIQVVLDAGLGLSTGQGSAPVLMLSTSRDGGKTYGPERWSSVGAQGAYGTRTTWNRCGAARQRRDRFTASDPVPYRVVDAQITFSVGAN